MNITVNNVEITLTKEQLIHINNELNKTKQFNHYTDIKTVKDALDYLKPKIQGLKVTEDYPVALLIQIVAKAINCLNNVKPRYNWYPYFNYNSIGLVSFYCSAVGAAYYSAGSFVLLKDEESSDYLGKQFLHLFQQQHNEQKVI